MKKMKLNGKIFNLFITWFISTIIAVALTPEQGEAKEAKELFLVSEHNSSLLLSQTQEQELDAFFSSGKYTYCDAKILADYWGQSTLDAKARIGRKLLSGEGGLSVLEDSVTGARDLAVSRLQSQQELCFFEEKGYTYDDAVALARFWGNSTPWEAKLQVEKYLILGEYQAVRNALRSANN
jgi:hypothetical protein